MHRTKIDWADYAWNPVTGCLHNCEYCYARKQTVRFSGDVRLNMSDERCKRYPADESLFVLEEAFVTRNKRSIPYPFGFAPTLHKYRMGDLTSIKSGGNIFVCSMSDLFGEWVPDEWIKTVFENCIEQPQHNYIFLTKNPKRYAELKDKGILPKGDNYWYGTTITRMRDRLWSCNGYNSFLSIEPLLEDFEGFESATLHGISWVIAGAETGMGKNKVIPEKSWVNSIVIGCNENNIPVFMKDSLLELMGNEFIQQFPNQLSKEKAISSKKQKKLMVNCLECKEYGRKAYMHSVTLRKGRSGRNKTIGYFCDSCLEQLSGKWGIEDEQN